MKWTKLAVEGTKPSARNFHAACLSPDQSQILIYGGFDIGRNWLQNLWAFSPEQRKWTQLSQSGSGPGKRIGHVMFRKGSNVFVGFGYDVSNDIYKININGNLVSWTLLKSDNGPCTRNNTSATTTESGDIIVHGG